MENRIDILEELVDDLKDQIILLDLKSKELESDLDMIFSAMGLIR